MIAVIAAATLALAAAAGAETPAALGHAKSCDVTHDQCYPACIQRTPDGSDCARTKQVCRKVCGERPVYPAASNTESPADAQPGPAPQ